MKGIEFKPIEAKMAAILEDGQPHLADELHTCLYDELSPRGNISPHLSGIRKKIAVYDLAVVIVYIKRKVHYQLVRKYTPIRG